MCSSCRNNVQGFFFFFKYKIRILDDFFSFVLEKTDNTEYLAVVCVCVHMHAHTCVHRYTYNMLVLPTIQMYFTAPVLYF